MNELELATIGANLESQWHKGDLAGYDIDHKIDLQFNVQGQESSSSYTLTLVDKMEYTNETGETIKAMTFKDETGNLYVHYRGTGDANWDQNTVAYDGGPSEIQTVSQEYLDEMILKYGGTSENVYVTGHSQGGNNAQYATMTAKYGDRVDMCVSMDGQGFSHDNVAQMKALYGQEHFEAQRDKIYAVHGDADPVSTFGQEQLIPEERTTYIQTNTTKDTFANCHHIDGMLNGTSLKPKTEPNDDSSFRKMVAALNEKVCDLPADKQALIATNVMNVAEFFFTGDNGENYIVDIDQKDLADIFEAVIPVVTDVMAEDPELVKATLEELGLGSYAGSVDIIEKFLLELDELSDTQKRQVYEALAECFEFTVDENGKAKFQLVADIPAIASAIFNLLPAITETVLDDPQGVYGLLKEAGILEKIENLVKEHPGASILIGLLVLGNLDVILTFAGGLVLASYILNAVREIVETIKEWGENIKAFVVNLIENIKQKIQKIKEYLRSISPGGKYSAEHPYIKADPDKLRSYASRLNRVNSRLVDLDRDMNTLYTQVKLVDLLDILNANLITSYSANVLLAKNFLNYAADTLETAENTAVGYMGG